MRLSSLRDGDKAEMAVIEFVESGAPSRKEKKGRRERRKSAAAVTEPVVDNTETTAA